MRKNIFTIGMLIAALCCMAGAAGASSIYFDPASLTLSPGATQDVKVMLSDSQKGLTGYELILNYPSSTVTVSGAAFPAWAALNNKYSTTGGYLISGIDLNRQVQAGASGIQLATVTFKGVAPGTATVSITGLRMDNDAGGNDTPSIGTLPVTVQGGSVTVTTTATTAPTQTTTTIAPTETTAPVTTTTTATVTATSTTESGVTATSTAAPTATAAPTTAAPAATVTIPSVVMVTPGISGAPTAGFTLNKAVGYAPLAVTFRDLSQGDSLSGWEWDFGDGATSMAQNPTYTYRTPGTYTVALTVTNGLGSTTSTRTGLIRVLNEGEPMPTVTQAAPPVTTVAPATPAHTMPAWTSPQQTATTAKKSASLLPTVLAGIGMAAALFLVLQKENRP